MIPYKYPIISIFSNIIGKKGKGISISTNNIEIKSIFILILFEYYLYITIVYYSNMIRVIYRRMNLGAIHFERRWSKHFRY